MSTPREYPVAPEFVQGLKETATLTALSALRVLNVPEDVLRLVGNVNELGQYLVMCAGGESLGDDNPPLDIKLLTIETVNAVVKCGGVFTGGETVSKPRPFPLRMKKRPVRATQP